MSGFLLGLVFAAGVVLIWLGAVCGVRLPAGLAGGSRWFLPRQELGVHTGFFVLLVPALGLVCGGLVWMLAGVPIFAFVGALVGAYLPFAWLRRRGESRAHDRERAWSAALAQLADALEAGIALPAAVALAAEAGPPPLRPDLAAFHARLRSGGLEAALDGLVATGERAADTVALLLRAGLLELPAGGLAPVLRELSTVLSERFEAREKARSRVSSLQLEAAILALSPFVLLLLVGLASPAYLDAYRTTAGTLVGALGGVLIFGCYLAMRRLGRVPEPRRTQTGRGA